MEAPDARALRGDRADGRDFSATPEPFLSLWNPWAIQRIPKEVLKVSRKSVSLSQTVSLESETLVSEVEMNIFPGVSGRDLH